MNITYEEFKEEMDEPEKKFTEYFCNDCDNFFNNEDFDLDEEFFCIFCPHCGSIDNEELKETEELK
jgi:hypothetical protein